MKYKLIILICILFVSLSGLAKAYYGAPYWTEQKAEATVFNSTWSDRHNVDDIACDGEGRPHIDANGNSSFKFFECDVYYITTFDYYGDVDCQGHVRVTVISDTAFRISNMSDMKGENCFVSP